MVWEVGIMITLGGGNDRKDRGGSFLSQVMFWSLIQVPVTPMYLVSKDSLIVYFSVCTLYFNKEFLITFNIFSKIYEVSVCSLCLYSMKELRTEMPL